MIGKFVLREPRIIINNFIKNHSFAVVERLVKMSRQCSVKQKNLVSVIVSAEFIFHNTNNFKLLKRLICH